MAGFGGLGGLGGFAFPTRRAMGTSPNSAPVQSDQEFGIDWQSQLDGISRYIPDAAANSSWSPSYAGNVPAFNSAFLGGAADLGGLGAVESTANRYGLTSTVNGEGGVYAGVAADGRERRAP